MANPSNESMRLDKWLWAARFYKTRALATGAINGGKVHLNGGRGKPSRRLVAGDTLTIQKGPYRFEVTVTGLSKQRRPASEARLLYTEAEASVAARHILYRQLQREGHGARQRQKKPDKHARARIRRFKHSRQP